MTINDPIADMLTRVRNAVTGGAGTGCDAEFQDQGRDCQDPEG